MPELETAPFVRLSNEQATRHYLVDMIEQLAHLARRSGEMHIAILLEAILAADRAAPRRI